MKQGFMRLLDFLEADTPNIQKHHDHCPSNPAKTSDSLL
jgi:hypothetical protein